MARLTISEAIERSPVGKAQFYGKYVKGGLLTVSVDNAGKKYVESSELLRCFGEMKAIQSDSLDKSSPVDKKPNTIGLAQLEVIKLLKEQIEGLKADKEFQQSQIVSLSNRLEAPPDESPAQREKHYQEQIANLTARLESPAPAVQPVKRQSRISKWWFGLDGKE